MCESRLELSWAPNHTAHTRCSCYSDLANPVQIVSTPPAPINGGTINVFLARRPCGPAGWLAMLLIKAGDVHVRLPHAHQTDTACSWLVCHSRGGTVGRTVGGNTVQIVSTYPASPEARPPSFFWEASRASPQHGWRSAYSLRETLSPTQDQNQHKRPFHTHALNPPHSPSTLAHQSNPLEPPTPTLPSPPTT